MIEDRPVCSGLMMFIGWTVSRIILIIASSWRRRYNRDRQHQPIKTCYIGLLLKLIVKSIQHSIPNDISPKKKKTHISRFFVSVAKLHLNYLPIDIKLHLDWLKNNFSVLPWSHEMELIDRKMILIVTLFFLTLLFSKMNSLLLWIYKSKKRIKIKKVWFTALRLQVDLMSLDISLGH